MTMVTENSQQVHMLTLRCSNVECMIQLRIGRILKNPVVRLGAFEFCPVCGSNASASNDEQENFWEALARAYGKPVEAIMAVFTVWNPIEQPVFKKFFDEMWENATDSE